VGKIIVIYAKFLLDVACQKLLKSANVSQSYSKNKSGFLFLEHGVYDMQFGYMKGKGTTGAIFIVRQMQKKFRAKGRISILALWIWKKLLIWFREK